MTAISDGDIVEIVMDVYHVSEPRGEYERVLVQGVFMPGSVHPPAWPAARRNVVQVFLGRNMGGIPAFLIMTALNEDGEVAPPRAPGEDEEPEGASEESAESPAVGLLKEALFLRMNGEYAPGGNENWHSWDDRAERFLRGLLPPEEEGSAP
jgi:hypothetical protein